jgi:hypothetical protein
MREKKKLLHKKLTLKKKIEIIMIWQEKKMSTKYKFEGDNNSSILYLNLRRK